MSWIDRVLSLQPTWRDAVDIVLVTLVIYNILALIRGTRAMQISIGLTLLGSTFFIARAFDLPALESISREILFYLPFAVIVLFQHEIRRALARMGANPLMAFFRRRSSAIPFDVIADACEILSARKIGALIAIEGSQSLRALEESSKPLDAALTPELIVAIFIPGGPLHDGATIIRRSRIVAAGALLPLTTADDRRLAHGTRHRAAIGLTEESDAFVIVVSEENGSIAAASEGALHENLERDALLRLMTERFGVAR